MSAPSGDVGQLAELLVEVGCCLAVCAVLDSRLAGAPTSWLSRVDQLAAAGRGQLPAGTIDDWQRAAWAVAKALRERLGVSQ